MSALVTVSDTVPPVITGISSVSLEPSVATVLWTTNELATSRLEYGTSMSYGSSATLPAGALLAHTATLTGLAAGTTYYFCIRATDLFGNSSSSCASTNTVTTAVVQTTIDTMPPTISLVTVAPVATTSASVSWTTDEVATGYLQYGVTLSYGSQTPLEGAFTLTHGTSLASLTAGTTYHYRVVSSDASGNTAMSPDNTFTTDAPVAVVAVAATDTTPPSIESIIAAPIGGTQSGVNWTTSELATATLEYGTTTSYGLSASAPTTALLSHATTLLNLTPNTTYYYCIRATDVAGNRADSCGHSFTTLATPIVVDPAANILSVSSFSVGSTSASVSFTTDENTNGSVRYGLTTAYETNVLSDTTLATSHTITLSSLLSGTTYHFRIKAVDSAANITYSDDHTFTTSGTAPTSTATAEPTSSTAGGASGGSASGSTISAPTPALIAAAAADSQIIFIWRNPLTSNFAGTTIVRKEGGYPSSLADGEVIYSGNSRTFTDTNLANGTTYYYSLYSKNAAGQYSNALQVSEAPKAGVHQVQLNENPVLQPALAIEHLTADMRLGDKSLEVVHLQQVLNTVNVHPSELTTGYFGPLTQAALKQFQTAYKLPQTGTADAATRMVLNALSQGWMVTGTPNDIANLLADLKRGDTGAGVASLQKFLAYEGSYPEGIISGYFGARTQKAVADFQKKFGVTPVSGYVGYKTRHTIQTVLGL
ncbi:peptidoglycan-binding protein [Candidatus Kaiserbacteria bacterium]|nr:peptidoglycan-binding protein [Candidatus Kaiserbacteria bacterium]